MNQKLQLNFIYYGLGSLGGFLAVLGFWFASAVIDDWNFGAYNLSIESFYVPMVWGGLFALLYNMPFRTDWWVKGSFFSLFPAFAHLILMSDGIKAQAYSAITGASFSSIDLGKLLSEQESWMWIGCYFIFWGLLTSKIIR